MLGAVLRDPATPNALAKVHRQSSSVPRVAVALVTYACM
jgi:hypothetical protein